MAPNVNHNNRNHNKTEGEKKRDTQRILGIDWQQGRSKPQIEIGIAYPKYTVTYTIYNPIYI